MARHWNYDFCALTGAGVAMSIAGFASVPARASTPAASMAVSATVDAACSTLADTLPFATYAGTQERRTATISVTCTSTTPFNVGLDAGTTSGATVSNRRMSDGNGHTLNYGLYRDSGYSTNWGDTVGNDTETGTGSGTSQSLTVYGQVPGGQSAVPGRYTDTITVIVIF